MISKCYLHLREEAYGKCDVCKKPVCRKCAKKFEGKLVCRNCVDKRLVGNVDADEIERQERLERKREDSRKGRT